MCCDTCALVVSQRDEGPGLATSLKTGYRAQVLPAEHVSAYNSAPLKSEAAQIVSLSPSCPWGALEGFLDNAERMQHIL